MTLSLDHFTYREIKSQHAAWAASLASVQAQAAGWTDWLQKPRAEVLFTGCGSTHYLALAAAANWQAETGVRARGVPASEIWLFPAATLPPQPCLLVAVSRSAETTETLRAVETYQARAPGDWMAVACYADRPLVTRAPRALLTRQAEEQSVAQTRSFTSMFMLTQALALLAADRARDLDKLQAVPACGQRIMAEYESLARQLAGDQKLERFVFLGSSHNYGLACEAMLKMKEMSLSPSEAFHFMEFRHGPKSVVTPGTLVVGLLSDTARAQEAAVLSEMRQLGASVLAVTESASGLVADHVVELKSGLDERTRSVLALPVLQLMAFYRAVNKGLNPDRPMNLDAVVKLET